DLVVKDGRAVGVVVRDLLTGQVQSHSAHAVVLATGGYGNVFFLSTNAKASNATAIWRAHRRGALFANPCYPQIHPTCIPASDAVASLGRRVSAERYGNLCQMYERITGEDPYVVPMRIYPAVHYTMGGLWVDYNLMSNVPGLYVIGEANFADQGANRLGASALMQGLADGYFVLPVTIGDYLAGYLGKKVSADRPEFKQTKADVED